MAVAGTYIRFAQSAATAIEAYFPASRLPGAARPSLHDLRSVLEAWDEEANARRMFAWKEPKKRIPVKTVLMTRRYEKRFTGRCFPVGGSKK